MPRPAIAGEVVHHTRDRMGPILVIDDRRHRILSFDSVFEQSKIDRRRPWLPVHEYSRAMLLPLAWRSPRRAAVLGVGGGAMVGAIHHLVPACQLQAVELRPEVIRVAREYFSLPVAPTITVTTGDARHALEAMTEGSTDLILADLYSADRMSPAQSRRQFIDLCVGALSEDGWLVLNYHQPPDPEGRLFRHMRRRFASLLVYTSKTNNTVIYGSRQPVQPIAPASPVLKTLEGRLPIGWPKLMGKLTPV
ncbi:MAG: spermidine synthase [Marinobacter sp.]